MRALVVLALAAAIANAASITWTGIADDNQWFNHINWSPAQVPGPNDDVSIPSGYVQVTAPTGCNSLSMGTLVEAPANLTLYQAFSIGSSQGLVVESNGNLVINTGLSMVFGQVTIGGTLNFIDGVLGGAWTVLDRAAANLGNGNEKGFSACTFQSKGALSLGGVIQLNQSSVFQIMSPVSVNTQLIIQQDDNSTGVLFDASTTSFTFSTSTLTIQAPVSFGTFTLQSGNITILNSLSFNQMFDVPAGSYVTALGTAQFNASSGISGAGVVSIALAASQSATIGKVTMTGAFNVVGGDTLFTVASNIGILTVAGGNAVFMADVMAQQLNLLNGQTAGNGIATGMNVLVSSRGFSLGSAVVANTTATFQASILAFGPTAAFKVADGAKATVTGALLLTGPPNTPGMTNNGQIDAQAAVSSQNIDIKGAGSVSVATTFKVGTLTFTQKAVTLAGGASFSGSNTFLTVGKIASATGGSVSAVIGDYTFSCPAQCDNMNTPNTNPPTSNFAFSA